MRIDRAAALQGEFGFEGFVPIQGPLPSFGLHGGPSVGKPQHGIAVTAIANERHVFRIRHRTIGEGTRLSIGTMTRPLVVECEFATDMTDLDHTFVERHVRERWRCHRQCARCIDRIDRFQRVLRKRVLDVGENEFLVLLLVLDTQLDQ